MRPPTDHLTNEEIDRFFSDTNGVSASAPGDDRYLLEQHLADCERCKALLKMHRAAQRTLANLQTRGISSKTQDCPEETVWTQFAANIGEADKLRQYADHALACDYCGQQLREALQDLTESPNAEEDFAIGSLKVSQPGWQEEMAEKMKAMAAGSRPKIHPKKPFFLQYRWAIAASVLGAIGLVSAWWLIPGRGSKPPEQLLSQAYSERRTLELRFGSVGYAPILENRGTGVQSSMDRPQPLIDAEAIISRGLKMHPGNPAWLQAKGRADLLAWNYDSAMKSFKQALESNPDSVELQTDLASAFFERSEATGQTLDYGTALELLGKALRSKPDDRVALFNQAIVAERMRLYEQAIQDWQRYLQLDSQGAWAEEAHKHLDDILKKNQHAIVSNPLPDAPEDFLRAVSLPGSPAWTQLRMRSEELIDRALISWLPQFVAPSDFTRRTAGQALASLARILEELHQDRWLEDVLDAARTGSLQQGFEELSRAQQANLRGDPGQALAFARRAYILLQHSRNQAGSLRAQFEMIYAFQRMIDPIRCVGQAQSLERQLRGHEYPWLRAQLSLEQSICQGMLGRFDTVQETLDHAMETADASNYGILQLRTIGMQASYYTDAGNRAAAWNEDLAGLIRYWDGDYPPIRAFQFYSDLSISAQKRNRWHLAAMLQREAAGMIAQTPNRSVEAMAWSRYGSYAQTAGMTSEAADAFRRADVLFAALPQDRANLLYRLDCELNRAMIETVQGSLDQPLERLDAMKTQIRKLDDKTVQKHFYQTLGILLLRKGDFGASKQALEFALQLSQDTLSSLRTGRERAAWEEDTVTIYRGLVDLLFRGQHDPAAALREWRSYHQFVLKTDKRNTTTTENRMLPGEKQTRLNPAPVNASIVTYAQLPEGIAIWVTEPDGTMRAQWVEAPQSTLARLVDRFAAECSNPNVPLADLQKDGRALYRLLIEPVAASLRTNLLVIETDGVLAKVPFQALVDEAGGFWGLKHPLLLSQGASIHHTPWPARTVNGSMRALVVGDPVLAAKLVPSFPPLPNARQEAEFVSGLFHDSQLLTRKEATPAAVKRGLLHAELFHFAGHAVFTPFGGRLLLSGPKTTDVLDYRDLEPAHYPRCRLVVMSSCSTETGEEDVANPDGLARAFLSSGVTHVVASRWNVDSNTTQSFMEKFYGSLLQGRSVPAALQDASIEIYSRPATAHPYYWAAFNVYAAGSGIDVSR